MIRIGRWFAAVALTTCVALSSDVRAADVLTQSPNLALADGSGRLVGTFSEVAEASIIEVRGFGPVILLLQRLNDPARLVSRYQVYFSRANCDGNAYLRQKVGRIAAQWLPATMFMDGRGQFWIRESDQHVPWAYDSARSRLTADGSCQSVTPAELLGWSEDFALTPVAPENAPPQAFTVARLAPGHVMEARLYDANGLSMGVLGYSLVLRTPSRQLVSLSLSRAADGFHFTRSKIGFTDFGCKGDAFSASWYAVDATGVVWNPATSASYPEVVIRSQLDASSGKCVDGGGTLKDQRRVVPFAQVPRFVEPFRATLVYR